jgi:hypothetical protein
MAETRIMTAASVTYAYCVIASRARLKVAGLPAGVPGGDPPRAVAVREGVWLVAADVPLSVYGEPALRENLRDLDWVSGVAVGHEAVVEHFTRLRTATVLPMKLLTLFSSDEKATDELLRRRKPIDAAMRRIDGCEEWGVRVFALPARAAGRPPAAAPQTGAGFLAARKAARDAAKEDRTRALQTADRAYEVLAGRARAATQRPKGGPGSNPPLLEAAFLVPRASLLEFKAAAKEQAARCASAGAQMTVTGPWPAYNFVGEMSGTK